MLRKELPEGFKIGAAVGKGDCFFDSVAQGLSELKKRRLIQNDEDFNVKLLREGCANYANKYEDEIIKDAGDYFVPQENVAFPSLGHIEDEKANKVPDKKKTFDKYLRSIKKTAKEGDAIWGRPEIEGKMICEKYSVKIRIIELRDEGIDGLHITKGDVGTGNNIIYIVNYRSHFVPLLGNIEKDIMNTKIELAQASQPVTKYPIKRKLDTEENDPTGKKRRRSNSFSLGDNNLAVYKREGEIHTLLEIFVEKFVEKFQEKLKDYSSRIIEKKEKQSSILSKLISLGFVGGGIKAATSVASARLARTSSAAASSIALLSSGIIDSLANRCIQVFQNQGAGTVARNTMNFQVSKSQFREVLIRASIDVFRSYENQYLQMISKKELGEKLGMEVLAQVAVQRAISYIKSQEDDIQTQVLGQYLEELYTLITKGVVLDNSKLRNLEKQLEKQLSKFIMKVRSLVSSKKKDFRDLFDENMYNATGLVEVVSDGSANQYYTRQDGTSDTKKYGYRLAFEWELKNGLSGWKLEENIPEIQYKYALKPEEIVDKAGQISKKIDGKSQVLKSDLEEIKDVLVKIDESLCKLHDVYLVQGSMNLVKNDVQGSVLLNETKKLKEDIIKISDEEQKNGIQELEKKLSVPVALQLAIVYIYQEKEKFKKRGGNKSWVSDYKKKLQEENLPDFTLECKDNHDVDIVAAACNIILKKIKEQGDLGIEALEVIEIMAYLDSDGVFIEEIFPKLASNKKEELWSSIELLEKYSLINLKRGQLSTSKLVQEAIKLKLRREGREKEVLKKVLQLKINIADTSQANSIVSIWSCYVSECEEFLTQFNRFSNEDRNSLLSLLIAHGQPQAAERILRDVDDDILKGITNIVDKKTGNTFLHLVAAHNALDIVKYLIDEKEVNFNIRNIYHISPFISATCSNAIDVVKYLIENKNAADLENSTYFTILNSAAYNNALDVIKYLVEDKNLIRFNSSYYVISPLHNAACNNALDVVKYLIEDKDAIKLNNSHYYVSLLSLAAYNNALSVMKYLIEKTANSSNVSIYDIVKFNFLAACNNAPDIIKYLTEEKHIINLQNLYEGKIFLEVAAYNSALDVVKYLIDKGVDFNAKNYNGETFLYFSIMNNISNVVKYLIEDKNVVDLKEQGKTLLSLATKNNALGVVKYLIDKGVDFNAKDYNGENLLHFAVANNILDIVKYLIEEKNAVDLKNQDDGETLLCIAAENNTLGVVKYLIEEKNAVDLEKNGKILLNLATYNDALDIVKYLIEDEKVVNLKSLNYGKDLLDLAVEDDALGVVRYLIEKKNVVDLNDYGKTLLKLALENDVSAIVKYLIEDQKMLDLENPGDAMAFLRNAIENNASYVVKYLAEDKGIVNFINNQDDFSALLNLALENDILAVVKCLVEDKGVINLNNPDDARAFLRDAVKHNTLNVVKYLIEEREVVNLNDPDDSEKLLYDAIEYGALNVVGHLIEGKVNLSTTHGCGKDFLDLAQKKLARDQGNEDLKEIVNLLHSKIKDHLPETDDKINDSPETDLSGITVDNLQKRLPKL